MILDIEKYNRHEITINEKFEITNIKFIEFKNTRRSVRQFKLLVDFKDRIFKAYIASSLINSDKLENLSYTYKLKSRKIFIDYHGLKVLDNLFCKDVQNIIISYLFI